MPDPGLSPAGRTSAARQLGERLLHDLDDGEPAPVAAMRLLMDAQTDDDARAALRAAAEALASSPAGPARAPSSTSRVSAVADLLARNPGAWETVRSVAQSADAAATRGDAIAHWAGLFDALVHISPEGSVALYSLGSPQLLVEATTEIVTLLRGWGLLDRACEVLDIGCGIGRLESALAAHVASITGIDIAPAMVDEARRRCKRLANVRFELCTGRHLGAIPGESVDLVLLVDTLPYVFLSGPDLAGALIGEVSRVLRADGSAIVLNVSYRGDADADLEDLARLAAESGLIVHRADWRPFSIWDAPAFELRRATRLRA